MIDYLWHVAELALALFLLACVVSAVYLIIVTLFAPSAGTADHDDTPLKKASAAVCIEPKPGTWAWAEMRMREGLTVRRASESWRQRTPEGYYESGEEPLTLAAAWGVDDAPVFVFVYADSRHLVIPTAEHLAATDWQVAA